MTALTQYLLKHPQFNEDVAFFCGESVTIEEVADDVRGGRTGSLEQVLAGDFDLFTP